MKPLMLSIVVSAVAVAQPLPPDHPPMLPAGHPPMTSSDGGNVAPPSSEELLKRLDSSTELKKRSKTFEIAAAVGKLYYANGRYAEAAEYLQQAVEKAASTRVLYAEQRKKSPGALPSPTTVGCAVSGETPMEAAYAIAKQKAQAGRSAEAASCARAALHALSSVEALLGNAKFIQGEPQAAVAVFDRLLATFDADPDGLYGRAAVLIDSKGDDVKSLKTARSDLQRFLKEYPTAPRATDAKRLEKIAEDAIAAGGTAKLLATRAAHPVAPAAAPADPHAGMPQLTPEMIEAVQGAERTPELVAGLGKLVEEAEEDLAKGRFQEALDRYKRVVPFEPQNGRAKAGMAWALVGLNRQPMADRIWGVAVSSDSAAVEKLGDTLREKGDEKGAKAVWSKLKAAGSSSPSLDSKLR